MELLKKYQTYVSNIEWHLRVNKPTDKEKEDCLIRLKDFQEVVNDLSALPLTPSPDVEKGEGLKCVAGCKTFTGGEKLHHFDCPYYPESISKRFTDLQIALKYIASYNGGFVEYFRQHNYRYMYELWERVYNIATAYSSPAPQEAEGVEQAERIVCAANYYDDGKQHSHQPKNVLQGFVVAGRRHHNCIGTFAQIVGFPYSDEAKQIHQTEEQGFLTTLNRFVDRKEAYKIAFAANQIIGPNKGYSENSIGLTSEDLY